MRRRAWWAIVGLALVPVVGGAIVLSVVAVIGCQERAAERDRITREYREIAQCRHKYAPYAIPADGHKQCLEALRAPGGADRLYVRVAPDYEVILYRPDSPDGHGRRVWTLSPNVLRVTRPAVDPSDGLDAQEAALLHHHYASQWIKDHIGPSVAGKLLWIDYPVRLADGTWSVESGMSLIAGTGLKSHIAADGSLIDMKPVFSPD
jgi:hypothetical protein